MLLDTFLKKLEVQPTEIRYDHYDNKYVLEFEKKEGYFPYIELDAVPKQGLQKLYFDVLNYRIQLQEKYCTNSTFSSSGFIMFTKLHKDNQLSTIDAINERLHAFYMFFNTTYASCA